MPAAPMPQTEQEVPDPRTRDEEHGRAGDAEHDGRAEVGLEEQQDRGRHEHGERLEESLSRAA